MFISVGDRFSLLSDFLSLLLSDRLLPFLSRFELVQRKKREEISAEQKNETAHNSKATRSKKSAKSSAGGRLPQSQSLQLALERETIEFYRSVWSHLECARIIAHLIHIELSRSTTPAVLGPDLASSLAVAIPALHSLLRAEAVAAHQIGTQKNDATRPTDSASMTIAPTQLVYPDVFCLSPYCVCEVCRRSSLSLSCSR